MNPAHAVQVLSPESTVYLVDSSIYVYRAWHRTPKSISDPQGRQVNALCGFAEFLLQLLAQTQARYLMCAFDHAARPTIRHTIYPQYKSGRSATPEHLRRQFPLCQQLARLMGIREYSISGYEADDIIDTVARHCRDDKKSVCVLSGDKDLAQCIENQDVYWDFANRIQLDSSGIEKRFGVKPAQIADMLALSGDKTDSIPGVPGVGFSTAARLLKKWGNLDILFDHLEQAAQMKFRGASTVAGLLKEHEPTVRCARRISGLFHIDDLDRDSGSYARVAPDPEALSRFLQANGLYDDLHAKLLSALERGHA